MYLRPQISDHLQTEISASINIARLALRFLQFAFVTLTTYLRGERLTPASYGVIGLFQRARSLLEIFIQIME